jgi:hypothetical protein
MPIFVSFVLSILSCWICSKSLDGFELYYHSIPTRTYKMSVKLVKIMCVVGICLELCITIGIWYWLMDYFINF